MSKLIKLPVRGAKGGGKGGGGSARTPIEAPDSLQSVQYAKIIDLISEGEIIGLVDGMKSIYLDDTPLQNADGTLNFNNVEYQERNGTQSQLPLIGFDGSEAESAVGVEILKDTPVARTISNTNNNAFRVTVSVPALSTQNTSNGDINGTSVQISIDIQNDGGGFVPWEFNRQYSNSSFIYVSGQASNSVAASEFIINTKWVGESVNVTSVQTATFMLQYRAVGDVDWIDYQQYSFSGKGSISTVTNNQNYIGNNIISIGSIYGNNTVNIAPSGTKSIAVSLASGLYEFRTLKTNGSRASLIGSSYGGTITIESAQGYFPVYTDTISGKASSKYQKSYRLELPSPGPWDIRVNRITADSASSVLQNKTFWDSYTEIVDVRLSYPNSALIGLKIDAKQFNNIPVRGYEAKGVLVKIPSNYDPLTRVYTGIWDGTFVIAWSDNPAWCFYDIISNSRYGLGAFVDETLIDKWALYEIAQYCDELVSDGFGGQEPRFTCSLYLQSQEEAFKVIGNIASIFRGMAYWASGNITPSQDSPKEASKIYTQANIIDGIFNYSGSSSNVRHTVALISWNDPLDAYKQKIEYVEDAAGISRYGVVQTDLIAIGCTSRGQAHRMGRWLLYSEQNETETITFKAAMDATDVVPGDVIKTSDSNRIGARFGGRLISATVNQLTLDSEVSLASGQPYQVSCILPDGTVETKTISNTPGTYSVINTTEDFTSAPLSYAIWIINSDVINEELWRIISIAEVDKVNFEITALSYRPEKYDVVESNLVLQPLSISLIGSGPPSVVANLKITESLYLSGLGVVGVKAFVSWDVVNTAVSYTLVYRKTNGNETIIAGLKTNTYEITPIQEGNYTVSLYCVDALGRKSQPAIINAIIYGKTTPPITVQDFSIIKSSGIGIASWALQADLDVQVGGNIVIRHSPLLSGATWEDGVILDAFAGNAISGIVPLITGTYMAKAIDSSGNWSVIFTSFIASEGMVTGFNTIETITESPSFLGSKSNTASFNGILQLSSTETIGSTPGNISTWQKLSSLGGISPSGTYEFNDYVDLTTVATRRLEADISARAFDTEDFISYRGLVSGWGSISGMTINDCDATLYISTTDDDPTGAPNWTEYTPFFVGDFTCRAARFKLDLISQTITHNIKISQLAVAFKVPV
jgi:predicted phage tail protein